MMLSISRSVNLTCQNGTEECVERSCPERSVSLVVYVLLYVAAASVSLLTVCGNLLVIVSVGHFKQLHTPANILILSLAVSDLMVGLFVMPFHLMWLIESCWTSGPVLCFVLFFVSFLVTCVSVHTVALIAVDRFMALNFPFLYSEKISPTVVCIATLCNWLFSLLYNFTILLINGNFTNLILCPGKCYFKMDKFSAFVDLIVVFFVPCTTIIILYSHVFVIAKKHAVAIRALQLHSGTKDSKNRSSDKSERKAAFALGILVFVFLLCLMPYYISILMQQFASVRVSYSTDIVIILFFLNSTINPIIYALFYPWFHKSLKLILTFKIFEKNSSLMSVL